MEKQYKTLIDELDTIVDERHLEQVKQVIEYLTKINNFKYELLNIFDMELIYKKITFFLMANFRVVDFKVVQNIHGIETIHYQISQKNDFNYGFRHITTDSGFVEIFLDVPKDLSQFQKSYLDTFLDEVTHILYVKYVLDELQKSMFVDHLTKLKNRQSFDEDMKEFIPLALREKMKLAVLVINIDRFRAVNDEHGTSFGDDFLKLYAATIKENIRSSDIAVRFGGGEFLVLLVNVLDEEKVLEIAYKLQQKLNEVYLTTLSNDHFRKTVCMGISMFPEDSNDINEVIKKAEIALIDAKDKGRNTIVRYPLSDDGEIDLF